MKKFKIILKIFAFIFIIKASFLVSNAFVWDDMGLDLYKNIDSGLIKLNSQMYSYELKWAQANWKISENLNKYLVSQWIKWCSVKNISENDLEEITTWNIPLLTQKLNKWCSKDIDLLNQISTIVSKYSNKSKNIAKQKAKDIYNISRVWLFSNGSIKDSPFDIVKDIKDIDSIIFTQDIPYKWVESTNDKKLWDYLQWKLDDLENKLNWWDNDNWWIIDDEEIKNNLEDKNSNWQKNTNSWNNDWEDNNKDKTKYVCPTDESWLFDWDLNKIKNWTKNNNWPINQNYNPGVTWLWNPFSYSIWNNTWLWFGEANSNIWKKSYKPVNDNNFFGWCKKFFCIKVEFITHKANLLMWWKTMSIEALMERSNKHLKKFVNSSLAQAKMTTNNFELGTIIKSLPDMFSMNIIITKRPVPMLKLDFSKKSEKEKHKDDPFSMSNLLMQRFKSVGLDYKRENDLSILEDNDYDFKNVSNNAELSIDELTLKNKKRQEELQKQELLDDHITKVILETPKEDNTEWLYKEFIELERFSHQIQNYTNELYKASNKMLDIPIHK